MKIAIEFKLIHALSDILLARSRAHLQLSFAIQAEIGPDFCRSINYDN